MNRRRIVEASKGVGKPKVGGPFELVDHDGREFTDADLKGGYSLVSGRVGWGVGEGGDGGRYGLYSLR